MTHRLGGVDWAVLVLLSLALAHAVLMFGGVVRSDRYIYLGALGLVAAVACFRRSRRRQTAADRVMLGLAVLLPVYVSAQLMPLPMAVLRVISPARAETADALTRVGAVVSAMTISVFAASTLQHLLVLIGYVLMFLLIRAVSMKLGGREWIAAAPLVAIATLEIAIGFLQMLSASSEGVRGTYANRNHFAGLLEMVLPFAVMYGVAVLRRAEVNARQYALAVCALGIGALALMSIVFSTSRMGFLSAGLSLGVVGTLSVVLLRRKAGVNGGGSWRWVAVVLGIVLAAMILLPTDQLLRRFGDLGATGDITEQDRVDLWKETLPLIQDHVLVGCGLGAFESAFFRYKRSGPGVMDDYVHNDYLQLLAELGVVGFGILALVGVLVLRDTVRCVIRTADSDQRCLLIACLGAFTAIGLHSVADFNLYIPANAMVLAWIAGLASGQAASCRSAKV